MPEEQVLDGTPDAPQAPSNDVPTEPVKDTTPAPDAGTPQTAPSEPLAQAQANESEPAQPVSAGTAQIPANEPIDTSTPIPEPPAPSRAPQARSGHDLLVKARATIQLRKQKKLERILNFLTTNHKITNDEVEKLLHVSDATATRYLSALEKQGKIKQTGTTLFAFPFFCIPPPAKTNQESREKSVVLGLPPSSAAGRSRASSRG